MRSLVCNAVSLRNREPRRGKVGRVANEAIGQCSPFFRHLVEHRPGHKDRRLGDSKLDFNPTLFRQLRKQGSITALGVAAVETLTKFTDHRIFISASGRFSRKDSSRRSTGLRRFRPKSLAQVLQLPPSLALSLD